MPGDWEVYEKKIDKIERILESIPEIELSLKTLSVTVCGNGNKELSLLGMVGRIETDLKNIGDIAREAKDMAEKVEINFDNHLKNHDHQDTDKRTTKSMVAVWIGIGVTFVSSIIMPIIMKAWK